ncbi:MAG: hypothetical protein GAK45_02037 [Pseudomonas citronellolis]|nr:MAG: hypothetical protein GAK45_02037 [Pseudomonas citronellolis]
MSLVQTCWDGRLELRLSPHEMRMSHWVHAPTLVEVASGRVLFDLADSTWDLLRLEEHPDALHLWLRQYPGDRGEVLLQVRRADHGLLIDGQTVAADALAQRLQAALG